MSYFINKKQREEDERMKKKVLAFLLASTMVIEPFSVASAADFSDGIEQDVVQFSDDGEDVPEVENDLDGADQFSTDVAGEGENSSMPFCTIFKINIDLTVCTIIIMVE